MITYIIIYFLYGLAFFSMGLLVALEGGRSSDERLRKALRPLAGFGIVHALHEWLEMFDQILLKVGHTSHPVLTVVALAILAFSFLSLAAFGSFLLANSKTAQRISLVVPLALEIVWVTGLSGFSRLYPSTELLAVAEVWTRYSLAIPASVLAAVGLVAQQQAFRRAGLISFGRDSLWAAVAFAWYGLVGQFFSNSSPLPPSNFLNEELFLNLFKFPVQILRAVMAGAASFFVIRFLRAFQVESERKIAELQDARLKEARQREALSGELFRRVVLAQESERQRIARDLHDETGQSLTAIGMGLRSLTSSLPHRPSTAKDTIRQLEILTADSLGELQRLISDLRPSHLDDLGLPSAIRWYAGKVQQRTNLKLSVDVAGEEKPLDEASRITLFRIVQEALNNIIKHSNASGAMIEISYQSSDIRIAVRDDGDGFNLEETRRRESNRPSLGLAGMQERASLVGGRLMIESPPGQGVQVEVTIPYRQPKSEVLNENSPVLSG